MSPYRTPATSVSDGQATDAHVCPDLDLLPALAALWLGSIVRVALGVVDGDPRGAEVTLAALAVVVVPYLARDALGWCFRRRML